MKSSVDTKGSVSVQTILGAKEVTTVTYADTIEVPAQALGENADTILTRIRFHDQETTYDVIGWNAATNSLICQKV